MPAVACGDADDKENAQPGRPVALTKPSIRPLDGGGLGASRVVVTANGESQGSENPPAVALETRTAHGEMAQAVHEAGASSHHHAQLLTAITRLLAGEEAACAKLPREERQVRLSKAYFEATKALSDSSGTERVRIWLRYATIQA